MIDIQQAWAKHMQAVTGPRGDEDLLHASDLHACDYATWLRINGSPQLDDPSAFSYFERGHAYEGRIYDALVFALADDQLLISGTEVTYDGIVGHLDFYIGDEDGRGAVIDVTTTESKEPGWRYGHVLKSAFYALALGVEDFCEIVMHLGFGGRITAFEDYWFKLDDEFLGAPWRERVEIAVAQLKELPDPAPPPIQPPIDPITRSRETWRCARYCRAMCPENKRWKKG